MIHLTTLTLLNWNWNHENQRAQFKESLYEMIYILVNAPTEENISMALVHIQDDYKTWELSIDKFLNGQLRAMAYTF
jgi:hypothetical protein